MPGQRPILAMSFIASLGITFEVLACTLPKQNSNLWPLLVYIFYLLLPVPMIMSRRIIDETVIGLDRKTSVTARDYAIFLTSGVMVSTFALPILMARNPSDHPLIFPVQCWLVEMGNILCFATIGLFCLYFKPMGGI